MACLPLTYPQINLVFVTHTSAPGQRSQRGIIERQLTARELPFDQERPTHGPGHFRSSDRSEVRPASDRFRSTAANGQPALGNARPQSSRSRSRGAGRYSLQAVGPQLDQPTRRCLPEPVARVLGFDDAKPSLLSPGALVHVVGYTVTDRHRGNRGSPSRHHGSD